MDNNDITVIQINKNLQLNLGYVGGTGSSSGPEADPIYTKDKPNIALKSEIPTKTSDLTNDSGFITTDDIPEVQINETDPIYTKDKPNIALKSELFSKDYNDLSNKPDLYTPKTDGDGSKFLADDGTYKTVQSGGSSGGSTDLSDYTGNVNLKYESGNSYLTTSDKTFTLGTKPTFSASQMNSGVINAGGLLSITTDTFRIMDALANYTTFYVDNYGNAQATSSIDSPNVRVNGVNVAVGQTKISYYEENLNIQPDNNQFYYPEYTNSNWSNGIYSLELNIYQNVDNFTLIFKTAVDFASYTINMYAENFLINKPFNFESNKKYIICIDKNIIFWSEIQDYVAEVQE